MVKEVFPFVRGGKGVGVDLGPPPPWPLYYIISLRMLMMNNNFETFTF